MLVDFLTVNYSHDFIYIHTILHRNLYFEYIFYEVVILDNFNMDKQTMDKLSSMINNGNLNNILSQIPPDTLKNFSMMMNGNAIQNKNEKADNTNTNNNNETMNNSSSNNSSNSSFDFSKIDMNTMMKMKSIIEKMNHTSDPRSNLLQSLKPYLRDEKKSKLDQYSNLLNMASLIELFNQNNGKENSSD